MATETPAANGQQPSSRLSHLLRQSLSTPQAAPPEPGPPATPPGTARPHSQPAVAAGVALGRLPGALPVGQHVIAQLRDQVSDDIVKADENDPLPNEAARRERARALVAERVSRWAVQEGRSSTPLTPADVERIVQAVFDAVFNAGPLQVYLDDPSVENVVVDGMRVLIDYFDQPTRVMPAVADTDEELIALFNRLASVSGHRERRLSVSSPMIAFRMPDGSRAEATLLTTRPYLAIRRHRIKQSTLEQMQQWGTLSGAMAAFLHALVLAGKTVLIAGDVGTGKTSLVRAMARKIPSGERVITLETDRELYLDEDDSGSGEGAHFVAMEARDSNGELVDGKPVGQITIADMYPHTLRMLGTRVIVGEVRDREAIPMLEAMSSGGRGSMCTLHAAYPELVLPRLRQLCRGMHRDEVDELVGTAVNFIVFLRQINETARGGRRHRFVSHILEVSPGEAGQPARQEIFAPAPGDPRGMPRMTPACLDELVAVNFDPAWLTDPRYGGWPAPLNLLETG